MDKWEPTVGKWNDHENYHIKEVPWRIAFDYARSQYDRSDVCWEYNVGNEKRQIPYITYVRDVLKILINEVHISDDYLLALGALSRVRELTDCSLEEIEKLHVDYVLGELNDFPRKNTDDMIKYYEKVFDGDYRDSTMIIILAELLFVLRQETCPCDDWEEDIKYYSAIEKMIEAYSIKSSCQNKRFLCWKIKEQLEYNKNVSRNINKKPEELYAGWDD